MVKNIKYNRTINNFKQIITNGIIIKHLVRVVIYYTATDSDRYINYFLVDELKKYFTSVHISKILIYKMNSNKSSLIL